MLERLQQLERNLKTLESFRQDASLEDANKLDDVRQALRRKDMKTATRLARVYALTPLTQ